MIIQLLLTTMTYHILEIHITEDDDYDMPQLISCVRPSRWKSRPACILGALDILEEYIAAHIND